MASLTHVCMWDEKTGYKRVTIEEACLKFPLSGVPANRGFFVCTLCAQNVLLTAPGLNIRHFRHTSTAQNKECEDRAQVYSQTRFDFTCHPMPIRIVVNSNGFHLQLGFFYTSSMNIEGSPCQRIRISCEHTQEFIYSTERLSKEGITYLDVGDIPSSKYNINYEHPSKNLCRYWPSTTTGISPNGTFFDMNSGKMLQNGGKAYLNQNYYLLQKKPVSSIPNEIFLRELYIKNSESWHLYKIHVTAFNASIARFFLARSIFLTEKETKLTPIWPTYIKDPYFIYHNNPTIYFYMPEADAELNVYPSNASLRKEILNSGKLYKITANSKEQLLSMGEFGGQGFSYLMKKQLDATANKPQVEIKSIDGKVIQQDISTKPPKSKIIILHTQFDGKVIILRMGQIIEIRRILANKPITIEGISFGWEVQIFQGCDVVRSISVEKPQLHIESNACDIQMVSKLRQCSGPMVMVDHRIGAIAYKYHKYPLTRNWIYKQIRCGKLCRDAYKLLVYYSSKTKG